MTNEEPVKIKVEDLAWKGEIAIDVRNLCLPECSCGAVLIEGRCPVQCSEISTYTLNDGSKINRLEL